MTEDQMWTKFDEIDTNSSGLLDKDEITEALRELGESAGEITEITGGLADGDCLDFKSFKKLLQPGDDDCPLTSTALSVPEATEVEETNATPSNM